MIEERIKSILTQSGFSILPTNNDDPLVNYGLNSLTLALLIMNLSKEFSIKIPVLPIAITRFISISSIALYIEELEKK